MTWTLVAQASSVLLGAISFVRAKQALARKVVRDAIRVLHTHGDRRHDTILHYHTQNSVLNWLCWCWLIVVITWTLWLGTW